MLDIKNEAQNMTVTDEDQIDWWTNLFSEVQAIEPKNTTVRRDGVGATAEPEAEESKHENGELIPPPNFSQVPPAEFRGVTALIDR